MTDQPIPENKAGPTMIEVVLETPLVRGSQTIEKVMVRKPGSGELRGCALVDVAQQDVATLIKILPRVTIPTLTEADIINLDPADLLSLGSELSGFLLGTAKRASLGL